MTNESANNLKPLSLETLNPSCLLFCTGMWLFCERILMKKMHSTESRCVTGPENTLFAGASVQLSAQKFYKLGQ